MTRIRQRTADSYYFEKSASSIISGPTIVRDAHITEYIVEDRYGWGSNKVSHYKMPAPVNDYRIYTGSEYRTIRTSVGASSIVLGLGLPFGFCTWDVTEQLNRLNWSKLPTSNEAGLIQLLAELDQTVAMFALRTWQGISGYRQMTWGAFPLIRDLFSILRTIREIGTKLDNFKYSDQYTINSRVEVGLDLSTAELLVRRNGWGDVSFHHPASVFLDRLGLHPDFATLWDLIPYSFLVDYFIPIGHYLEGFRQGGWLKTMQFQGWASVKGTCSWSGRAYTSASDPYVCKWDVYQRWLDSQLLVADFMPSPVWFQTPSFIQMFHAVHLALGS